MLFLLGVVLAVANVWFAAARSTIPLRLDGKVVAKRQLSEKHPGKDDVYLLDLHEQSSVQVDKHVFDAVNEGKMIRKERWSRQLEHDGHTIDLEWSTDLCGMLWTMAGSLIVMLMTMAIARVTDVEDDRQWSSCSCFRQILRILFDRKSQRALEGLSQLSVDLSYRLHWCVGKHDTPSYRSINALALQWRDSRFPKLQSVDRTHHAGCRACLV